MSQQIRVLQCSECGLYQVDIVKKSNKWECKICLQKQNVGKEFLRGSGAECRAKVQHLNLEQAQKSHVQDERKILAAQQNEDCDNSLPTQRTKSSSKWANYVDAPIAEILPAERPRAHCPQAEWEASEKTLPTRNPSGSGNKRTSESQFVVNKKPCSKWQNFL
ncbi:MRN complex-interacting protein [Drosophila grimshawi]|uniref:MRN complex-interacting protein n=1 Tax=Drosophila grimshawi TaxID=7222 RepID=UPI000C86F4DC|nr:MRN complex-interacting protein [Drosophila grimshawi]